MNAVLFLPQKSLDAWLEDGRVDLGGDALIFTADHSKFPVVPAVHLTEVVDGQDAQKLVGKVKAVEALRLSGAEISMGAVVLGETAYQTVDGFMVTVPVADQAAANPAKPAAKAGGEADLLAQFILDKLS